MPKPNFENPDFNHESEKGREQLSAKEKKEKSAYRKVIERLKEKMKGKEEKLEKNPTFESKGRKFEIESEADYMVADAQKELEIAQEILEEAREKEEYYLEKAAAKLVDFLENMNSLVQSYAELKAYRPDLAKQLENKIPWLSGLYYRAQKNWDDQKNNNTKTDE